VGEWATTTVLLGKRPVPRDWIELLVQNYTGRVRVEKKRAAAGDDGTAAKGTTAEIKSAQRPEGERAAWVSFFPAAACYFIVRGFTVSFPYLKKKLNGNLHGLYFSLRVRCRMGYH
jgi:hypothetical protein